jgi:hypothetical protein
MEFASMQKSVLLKFEKHLFKIWKKVDIGKFAIFCSTFRRKNADCLDVNTQYEFLTEKATFTNRTPFLSVTFLKIV